MATTQQLTQRQLVVRYVNRAINTGITTPATFHKEFLVGRSTAFVEAAADALNALYGCDAVKAKHVLGMLVRDVRKTWPLADIADGSKVQREAEAFVDVAIEQAQ